MLFICLFIPAVLATVIDFKIKGKELLKDKFNFLISWCIYLFLVNLLTNTICWIFFENRFMSYSEINFTIDIVFKYMWISFIFSILLPFLSNAYIKRCNVSVKIETKNK